MRYWLTLTREDGAIVMNTPSFRVRNIDRLTETLRKVVYTYLVCKEKA
jgi:hypothetical protein